MITERNKRMLTTLRMESSNAPPAYPGTRINHLTRKECLSFVSFRLMFEGEHFGHNILSASFNVSSDIQGFLALLVAGIVASAAFLMATSIFFEYSSSFSTGSIFVISFASFFCSTL